MKIDWSIFLTVVLAVVAVQLLNKLFLDKALEQVFNWEAETYED